ncbi:MAG: ribonuclease III [Candidatus Lloydbacteria bacterium RIFCSPHIGHO2_01_FULL_41_20]|uniref:Ribonuclease 3 n=1 Tax=Candidatus Lloydbacteria bacterium RIFCSPHIGHO2_01_FULL_41_20 TaxID=1798657 RepID=A0A1G2CR22_9BACT|nr:MAG: ribonuclease III [Candidatus Lloydbacteria bacterium RIFCSPHIGHO2_01_FULL_41_20]
MIDFSKFEKKVGVKFKDKGLLKQAFVHRSYINENPKVGINHNERLEFLGDAVLQLVVTDYLYKKYTDKDEGDLTSYRASLVNANTISDIAAKLGMNEYLLLSKGEAKDTGKARQYILANVFESFVGALYLDQGYDKAEKFIAKCLFGEIEEIIEKGLYKDAKSLVQEKAQEYAFVTPAYKVIKQTGPDHDRLFTVGIYFGDEPVAEGTGKSKQEAEQKAAQNALVAKKWNK